MIHDKKIYFFPPTCVWMPVSGLLRACAYCRRLADHCSLLRGGCKNKNQERNSFSTQVVVVCINSKQAGRCWWPISRSLESYSFSFQRCQGMNKIKHHKLWHVQDKVFTDKRHLTQNIKALLISGSVWYCNRRNFRMHKKFRTLAFADFRTLLKGQCHDKQWFLRFFARAKNGDCSRKRRGRQTMTARSAARTASPPKLSRENVVFLKQLSFSAALPCGRHYFSPHKMAAKNHQLLWHCRFNFHTARTAFHTLVYLHAHGFRMPQNSVPSAKSTKWNRVWKFLGLQWASLLVNNPGYGKQWQELVLRRSFEQVFLKSCINKRSEWK